MSRPRILVPVLIACALAALSIINIVVAGWGITRRTENIRGVPMEIFLPSAADSQLPTVLVVHGFSGNKQLMYGFGYTLAKNGYAAALIDFAGHGASLDRMPDGFADAQYNKLAANIDVALAYLRQQPFVDKDHLAILGHSMGASAVVRYGSTHPDVPVTIALSLGNFGEQLPNDSTKPRNMLIMVGAVEFAGFIQGSAAGLQVAYPNGSAGNTYGDFDNGTARRLFSAPGVEHISILFSHAAYREMMQWLDQAFGVARTTPIATDSRIGWVLLMYLAAIIGFWPVARILFTTRNAPMGEHPEGMEMKKNNAVLAANPVVNISGWHVSLISFIAAALAVLLLRFRLIPYSLVPLTVGNYVGAFFLLYGAIVGTYTWLKVGGSALVRTMSLAQVLRLVLPTLALSVYALVMFALTGHLTWNNFALVGDRAWIALALFGCCLVFFLADEVAVMRVSRWNRLGLYALTKLFVLIALTVAVFALGAPGFLLLLLPVMVVLFIWQGLYSHWLFGFTQSPWPGAVLNAVVFAWMIASTFALVA